MTEKIFNNLHVLDGAMSTELEKRGVATNNKLWTAKALIDEIGRASCRERVSF